MGGITSMLGLAGGAAGTGFAAPTTTNIQTPVTSGQATDQYGRVQSTQDQQQALVQALQAQNGIGNQSNVFNQLQGVANGTGPNPAQAQLAQATGANTANQAALMAGQRGSGANAGLMARQAAMQGGANQQNAAGQAATMQANQSLGALGQMGQMAGQQVNQQMGQTQAANQGAMQEQSNLLNSIQGANTANVGMQSNINSANAQLAGGAQGMMGSAIGGLAGGAGKGLMSAFMKAEGGMIHALPQYADGGNIGPRSGFLQTMSSMNNQVGTGGNIQQTPIMDMNPGGKMTAAFNAAPGPTAPIPIQDMVAPQTSNNASMQGEVQQGSTIQPTMAAAQGGKVPAMVSPGEKYLNPQEAQMAKQGADPMQMGETIPGKPKVNGAKNDYANDIVPKTLEEGGLVLPRSVTQAKNPEWAAHAFVRAHMAKGGMVSGLQSKSKNKKAK